MLITSRNGRRSISVSHKTLEFAIEHITSNPGHTVVEYANATGIAESTLNLIIGRYLFDMAAAGRIAVSSRGAKPDWYYDLADTSIVPVVAPPNLTEQLSMPGVTDRQLRRDCSELFETFQAASTRKMSPGKRKKVRTEFSSRLQHVGGTFQQTIDESKYQAQYIDKLEAKIEQIHNDLRTISHVVSGKLISV